jgi:DNA modification methylase
MGRDEGESYGDDKETYRLLVNELIESLPTIASKSCHLMFWFSNKWEIEKWTREQFAPSGVQFAHYPLIWLKSDNAGVASIPSQQPRHIYEAALFGTIGERPLVRLKSDAYAAPTDKSLHTSCKPEPMLRHFMEMLIDEHTVMLDPTCGSGSSIRAAESLGAKLALGLEIDPKMAEVAERRRASDETKRAAERRFG